MKRKWLLILVGMLLILAVMVVSVSAAPSEKKGGKNGVWCYQPGSPNPADFDFTYRIGENDFFTGSYDSVWRGPITGTSKDNGLVLWKNFPANGPAIFVDLIAFEEATVMGETGGLELYLYGEQLYDYWHGPWFIASADGDLEGLEGRGRWWGWRSSKPSGCPEGYIPVHYNVSYLRTPDIGIADK